MYGIRASVLFVILCIFCSSVTLANEPDPVLSEWQEHVGISPQNNCPSLSPNHRYEYEGWLRDVTGEPVVNWPATEVRLNFTDCDQNPFYPPYVYPDYPSDQDGRVVFADGLCFGGRGDCTVTVDIRIGAWYAYYTIGGCPDNGVRSPDVDGDYLIALADLHYWRQAFVNQQPLCVGDLDLDGFIALSDLALWQAHFNSQEECPLICPPQ